MGSDSVPVPTIGVDFVTQTLTIDNKFVKLQIWDTAGQERFKAITRSYIRGASAILAVFDVTNRSSFDSLAERLSLIAEMNKDSVVMVVANKCNSPNRVVSNSEGVSFAASREAMYRETAGGTKQDAEVLFNRIAQEFVMKQMPK
eukprot:c16312_g1_i6.p2 GENE.c16312_g1_i6~~c16312_g1_i6.p2  ORF type:complete len:145 (-),score=34.08 c16312_g1_i6:207-641(-)